MNLWESISSEGKVALLRQLSHDSGVSSVAKDGDDFVLTFTDGKKMRVSDAELFSIPFVPEMHAKLRSIIAAFRNT